MLQAHFNSRCTKHDLGYKNMGRFWLGSSKEWEVHKNYVTQHCGEKGGDKKKKRDRNKKNPALLSLTTGPSRQHHAFPMGTLLPALDFTMSPTRPGVSPHQQLQLTQSPEWDFFFFLNWFSLYNSIQKLKSNQKAATAAWQYVQSTRIKQELWLKLPTEVY